MLEKYLERKNMDFYNELVGKVIIAIKKETAFLLSLVVTIFTFYLYLIEFLATYKSYLVKYLSP